MGLKLDRMDEAQVVEHIVTGAASGQGGWALPTNLDVLRQWTASEEVRSLVDHADLVVADGMPLIWASRLAGVPLPERVAGSSLIHTIVAATAGRGIRMFLLGGAGTSAQAAAAQLRGEHPDIDIAGTYSPPFGFERDAEEMQRIRRLLRSADPRVVFVGMGFPKQDRLIARLRKDLPQAWFVSCGVSFSFVARDVERAPRWVQRLGLEWLSRLLQEPRRLYRRYLIDGPPFLLRLLAGALKNRRHRSALAVTSRKL